MTVLNPGALERAETLENRSGWANYCEFVSMETTRIQQRSIIFTI